MKTFFIFFIMAFSLSAHSLTCSENWKTENTKNPILESCQLDSPKGGVELVQLTAGCAFPGPEAEPCFVLRSCGPEKELGASVFRQSSPLDSYCLLNKEQEVMAASPSVGVKAFVTCSGVGKPTGIKLITSDGKSKTCPFPFKSTSIKP